MEMMLFVKNTWLPENIFWGGPDKPCKVRSTHALSDPTGTAPTQFALQQATRRPTRPAGAFTTFRPFFSNWQIGVHFFPPLIQVIRLRVSDHPMTSKGDFLGTRNYSSILA